MRVADKKGIFDTQNVANEAGLVKMMSVALDFKIEFSWKRCWRYGIELDGLLRNRSNFQIL
ncbi:MAG: hypothetical protein CR997_04275 [Acidobacteria bacterium]|nr:MAG: hypothetical protein CR997_04275 [Acidobacteriota bacterium]